MVILVLSSHGTKLGKHNELFKISYSDKDIPIEYFPAEQVEEILIECSASISTEAIKLASKYTVPVLFIYGNDPLALLLPFSAHGTVQIRREQIAAYNDRRGVVFISKILAAASINKIRLIKDMLRRRSLSSEVFEQLKDNIDSIEKLIVRFNANSFFSNVSECRETFFATEAEITKRYYQSISLLLKDKIAFDGRTRRPPRDPVNSLLSYGYAVLTAQIFKAVVIAGLEPYAGFLHTDRSGKVSFVLDLIEIFRQPVIDRLVFTLFSKKIFTENDFTTEDNGMKINENSKKRYLELLYERLRESNIAYKNTHTSFLKIFVDQARSVGKYFCDGTEFRPFIM